MPLTPASAQWHSESTQHYITASLAGGSGLGTSCNEMIESQLGGEGQVALSYELLHRGFFFSIGVGGDYRLSRYQMANDMVHSFARQDRDGHDINYRYAYSDYKEKQHTACVTIPLSFGYYITDNVYASLGVKTSIPLWDRYTTQTLLYTEGEYPNLIDFVSRNVPSYGFYPTMECSGAGIYNAPTLSVSPMAELGAAFELSRRVSCRLGLYVEYAIPVIWTNNLTELVDYSGVDANPLTQTKENLQSSIMFHSVLNSQMNAAATAYAGQNLFADMSQYLSFGIRATFRFNIAHGSSKCMCLKD